MRVLNLMGNRPSPFQPRQCKLSIIGGITATTFKRDVHAIVMFEN